MLTCSLSTLLQRMQGLHTTEYGYSRHYGFITPANSYTEYGIDLNEHLYFSSHPLHFTYPELLLYRMLHYQQPL